jgi:hypothetical protein
MQRICDFCRKSYDDAISNTICPHPRFISQQDAKQKDLAFSLVAKDLQFNHTKDGAPLHIQSINSCGMVTLRELPGEFAPHLFKEMVA